MKAFISGDSPLLPAGMRRGNLHFPTFYYTGPTTFEQVAKVALFRGKLPKFTQGICADCTGLLPFQTWLRGFFLSLYRPTSVGRMCFLRLGPIRRD